MLDLRLARALWALTAVAVAASCNAILGVDERPAKTGTGATGTGASGGSVAGGGGEGGGLPAIGSPCDDGAECASTHCVDGVCCESACDGPCQGCWVEKEEGGICAAYVGSDPKGDCGDGVCDGRGGCVEGAVLAQRFFGSPSDNWLRGLTMLPAGGPVILAATADDLDLGTGALAAFGGIDLLLAAYDEHLQPLWAQRHGTPSSEQGWALVQRSSNELLFGGLLTQPLDLGSGLLSPQGAGDAFWAAIDPTGTPLTSAVWGGAGSQDLVAGAFDAAGMAYVLASTLSDFTIGNCTAQTTNNGDSNLVVAKLDSDLETTWCRGYELGWDQTRPYALAVNGDAVYVAGAFHTSADLGDQIHGAAGGLDGFVMRLRASDGATEWSERFGAAGDQRAWGVAVDSAGGAILAGGAVGTTDFDGDVHVTTTARPDAFVVRIDAQGNWGPPLWIGDDLGTDRARALTLDADGSVLIGGDYGSDMALGSSQLTSEGGSDAFVAKLSPDLEPLWAVGMSGPGNQFVKYLAVRPDGLIAAGGSFREQITIGGVTQQAAGEADFFLVMLSP